MFIYLRASLTFYEVIRFGIDPIQEEERYALILAYD